MSDLAQVHFCVPASAAAAVESFLLDHIGSGIEQRDAETLARPLAGQVEFVCWLSTNDVQARVAQVARFLDSLQQIGMDVEPFSWRQEPAHNDDWVAAYKKHFQLNHVGRRFVIKPTWENYEAKPQERLIELDPGMAFGTGLHASTRLAMSAIERVERSDRETPSTVLDIGCGTGILALAAARVWHRCRVLAIDIDEAAVDACRHNTAQNGLSGRVRIDQRSGLEVSGSYDLVLANLSYDALINLRSKILKIISGRGRLILSGLLADQAAEIAGVYGETLRLEPEYTEEEDGWRVVLLRAL